MEYIAQVFVTSGYF